MYFKAEGQKVFGTYVFGIPVYNIRDPELIRRILVKDFDHFVDRQANQFRKVSRSKTDEVIEHSLDRKQQTKYKYKYQL
jgi:hypothetical protein